MMLKPVPPLRAYAFPLSAATIAASLSLIASQAPAQNGARGSFNPALIASFRFTEQTGEALYANSCQACHMPDGKGATGAGAYPALAGNKNLQARGYPVSVVVNGQRGMPPIGFMMSNEQVAAVVNYVRTHFGNDYSDAVTAEDVNAVRP
jgi:mono/diheme cytochrome c family protein